MNTHVFPLGTSNVHVLVTVVELLIVIVWEVVADSFAAKTSTATPNSALH